MKAEFDIQLSPGDMYRFNLYHTYTSLSGYVPLLVAIVAFAAAVRSFGSVEASYTALYLCAGVLLVFYTPVTLYLRSKQQVTGSPVLSKPLHYVIDDVGVTTSQGEASATLEWDQVYHMVATKSNLLIFSNPRNAFVIPRVQVEKDYETVKLLAKKHLDKYRIKI